MSLFFTKEPVRTDDAKIHELLTRGVEKIFPSAEFLEKKLKSGERQTLYLGIDPTGPTLHIGHLVPLLKLRQFQDMGHRVILLIGDFTAQIGDPTDKGTSRKLLTHEEVLSNAKLYQKQASRLLSFQGSNSAELKYNSEWLGKLSFKEVVELLAYQTHADMIKRDMFQKRITEGKELYMHEFLYPLMQGYDSVAMEVDGEVGGNDQTFNMLVGRDLLKKIKDKEKFVIATKLLADSSGKKMGKTEGNMVTMEDAPNDMFGKVMSWPDSTIIHGFELCTAVPLEKVKEHQNQLESGTNPKEVKLALAEAIVELLHGHENAIQAKSAFEATFSAGKPEDFMEVRLDGKEVAQALIDAKVVASKTDLRRLIGEKAITNLDSNNKVGEEFLKTALPGKYRIGKHRFVRIQ